MILRDLGIIAQVILFAVTLLLDLVTPAAPPARSQADADIERAPAADVDTHPEEYR